jgi:GNAT superfamily N-acetyltransferase
VITYQVEQWRDVAPEMTELWQAHWEEVAINRDTIKLAVDHKSYEAFADAGALHVVTARGPNGIVGYHITIVRPHLHYVNDLHGFTDVYYISPEHRQGWTAVKLFKAVERTLAARGVRKIFTGTKLSLDMGRLFERLGFHETERLYTKVLNVPDNSQNAVPCAHGGLPD